MINRISKTSLLLATCKLEQNLDLLPIDCSTCVYPHIDHLRWGSQFLHSLCLSGNRRFSSKYLPQKLEAFFGSEGSERSLHRAETTQSPCAFWRWGWAAIEINNHLQHSCVHRAFK